MHRLVRIIHGRPCCSSDFCGERKTSKGQGGERRPTERRPQQKKRSAAVQELVRVRQLPWATSNLCLSSSLSVLDVLFFVGPDLWAISADSGKTGLYRLSFTLSPSSTSIGHGRWLNGCLLSSFYIPVFLDLVNSALSERLVSIRLTCI